MRSTRRRVAASEAARFTLVVVLPTPPFWLVTAMTLPMAHQAAFGVYDSSALGDSTAPGEGRSIWTRWRWAVSPGI